MHAAVWVKFTIEHKSVWVCYILFSSFTHTDEEQHKQGHTHLYESDINVMMALL